MESTSKNSKDNTSDKNIGESTAKQKSNREKSTKRLQVVDNLGKKFLKNFDPEHSEREKRKLYRRLNQGNKKHVAYDERGIYVQTGDNLCDCLNLDCAGCHFPCPKCYSPKCGHECRNNRKWTYESIENEGCDIVMKNPLLKET